MKKHGEKAEGEGDEQQAHGTGCLHALSVIFSNTAVVAFLLIAEL